MTKIAVISDLHYYSPELGISGRAYELRSGSDQKCLAESGAITDCVLEKLAESDIDALLIAGDITNDGEMCSHSGIFEKLSRFSEKKPVYLITSTHDWCSDGNPRRFEGDRVLHDVQVITPAELSKKYLVFGKDREIAAFGNGAGFYSRVFQISDELRLLAINDDCDGKNGASGYSEEHLSWAVEQIKKAEEDNCLIIAMEHHLLLHGISPLINKSQSISDNFYVAGVLADAGLRLIITGHSHMHRVTGYTSVNGNRITQLNVGALCGYPAPVSYIVTEDRRARISTEFIDEFTFDGKKYNGEFIKNHTTGVFTNLLNAAVNSKNDLDALLRAEGIKVSSLDILYPLIRFFAGKIQTLTVGGFIKLINIFTFGRGIGESPTVPLKNEKLLTVAENIFLSVFDGSVIMKEQSDEVRRIFVETASLPDRAVKFFPVGKHKKEKIRKITGEISSIANELAYPSLPDNTECNIDLC